MVTHHDGTPVEERALNVYIKLQRAADAVTKRCRTFRDAGLTESQFGALDAIYHLGPLHQKEIGEKILKTDANTTTVVDNLEERGLVERRRDPDDRRCYLIELTDKGTRTFESVFQAHVDRIVEVFDVLSDDEQEALARLCKKVGTHEPDNVNTSDSNGGAPS